MKHKIFLAALAALFTGVCANAQTASSLFWRADSLQRKEIVSEQAVQYNFVGHHGPAVENSRCALRIYFNDSGAIDVYSKSGAQMELLKYHWYPTEKQMAEEGAGCDEYLVGRTVGLGGIASATDAIEFLLAGATAVELGTANFIDPGITVKVVDGINEYLDRHGFKSVKDIIGALEV